MQTQPTTATRESRADCRLSGAYIELRDELIDALTTDARKEVRTPGFSTPTCSAAEVVCDGFHATDPALIELLAIVALAASGKTGPELHIRANGWIAAQAEKHAEFHRDDLIVAMEDAESLN